MQPTTNRLTEEDLKPIAFMAVRRGSLVNTFKPSVLKRVVYRLLHYMRMFK